MNKSPSREDTIEEKSQEDIQRQSSNDKNDDLQLKEKLKESELRYRRLFESAKDGILILDFENGNIIDANPYIVNMIDLPLVEILGKKLWEIGLFSNKEESELAFTELKTNGYIRFEDMPVLKRNGKIKEVEFISNVYPTGNSKLIQCNIRDITERVKADFQIKENIDQIKRVNNELILSKNKAEESDKLKSSFLANMSHEIRTPMNAIIGFSEFLLDPELSKDKLEKYVHIIVASSQQLLTIINDIIDISNELIQVKTDGSRIRQVICNLLNNAIKFTKEGEIMDLKMPVMDGNEAMRLIKQIEPELTVIAQTAYANSYSRKKAIKGGFDNYITKPIDSILFMEVINSYLSKSSTHEK